MGLERGKSMRSANFHWKAADHNLTLLTTSIPSVKGRWTCGCSSRIYFRVTIMYRVLGQLRTMLPDSGSRPMPANKLNQLKLCLI